MNSKLHPAIAALVIALAVLALALWIWARGQARELGGPAQLLVGPSGHLYVQINDQLLEHGADGEFLRRHDLSGPAASELVGGIGFLANGDLLLRRAANNRSLFARLRAFGRTTSTSPPARDTPGTGLCRYRLEDSTCRPFGAQGLDPGAAFGLVIDPASGDVYLSDTSRHVLRKYASDGKPLAGPVGGFRFPNGLALVDGKLYVADTNMHRVAIVDPRNDSFGDLIGTRDVVPDAARVAGQRWPTRIVRVGDAWWVNNMNTALEYGGIYVFDDDWHYRRRVELPPGADPIDLLPYRGEVLISDWYNDRVYRVSAAGTLLGRFSSTGIDALLGAYRHERLRYGLLSYAGVAVLAMVFLVLIVHALVAGSALGAAGAGGAEPRRETATGTDPCWLYPDQRALVRV
ncbi:MAG TPA: hypothetical protein VFE85_05550, partial [Woeseiaceae bacterium]|nr:hypothetical protein [Woeseiaceae bacterium]